MKYLTWDTYGTLLNLYGNYYFSETQEYQMHLVLVNAVIKNV
jgi:hypothetical protein